MKTVKSYQIKNFQHHKKFENQKLVKNIQLRHFRGVLQLANFCSFAQLLSTIYQKSPVFNDKKKYFKR